MNEKPIKPKAPRKSRAKKAVVAPVEIKQSRQVRRRNLFETHFVALQMDGQMKHRTRANPNSALPNRKQRRALARAFSIGQWRKQINSTRLAKGLV